VAGLNGLTNGSLDAWNARETAMTAVEQRGFSHLAADSGESVVEG
jgi:hypothetical protein